jgi:hypothetical protein
LLFTNLDPLTETCRDIIECAKKISQHQHYAKRDTLKVNDWGYHKNSEEITKIVNKTNKQPLVLPSLRPETVKTSWNSKFELHHAQLRESLSTIIADRSKACLNACRDETRVTPVIKLVMKKNSVQRRMSKALPHIWIPDPQEALKESRRSKMVIDPQVPKKTVRRLKKIAGISNPAREADQLLSHLVKQERDEKIKQEEEEYAPKMEDSPNEAVILRGPVHRGLRLTNEVVRFSFEVLGRKD